MLMAVWSAAMETLAIFVYKGIVVLAWGFRKGVRFATSFESSKDAGKYEHLKTIKFS